MSKQNKGFTSILIIIVLVIIAFGVWYFASTRQSNIETETTTTPNITQPTESPAVVANDWKTYENTTYEFTFRYPPEANVNDTGSNYMSVNFMGQKQIDSGRTQTELFDGYAMNVVDLTDEGDFSSLDDFAEARMSQFDDVCSMVSEPKTGSVNENPYITVDASCLGDFTIFYFENSNRFYEVGLLVTGDKEDTPGYQQTVNDMFSTFTFLK